MTQEQITQEVYSVMHRLSLEEQAALVELLKEQLSENKSE